MQTVLLSNRTKSASVLPYNFYESYSSVFEDCSNRKHLINNFECLGMLDPFPHDRNPHKIIGKLPKEEMDLVYPESRYEEASSPCCLYIPNANIMFQIMRACI